MIRMMIPTMVMESPFGLSSLTARSWPAGNPARIGSERPPHGRPEERRPLGTNQHRQRLPGAHLVSKPRKGTVPVPAARWKRAPEDCPLFQRAACFLADLIPIQSPAAAHSSTTRGGRPKTEAPQDSARNVTPSKLTMVSGWAVTSPDPLTTTRATLPPFPATTKASEAAGR